MPPKIFSRYQYTAQVFDEGLELSFLTDREPYRFREFADNLIHHVVDGDTLFTLAHERFEGFARPERFYWVIADFQPVPIIDPTLRLVPGSIIFLMSKRTLQEEVFNSSREAEATP